MINKRLAKINLKKSFRFISALDQPESGIQNILFKRTKSERHKSRFNNCGFDQFCALALLRVVKTNFQVAIRENLQSIDALVSLYRNAYEALK